MKDNTDSKIDIIKIFYESRRFETDLYWKRSQYFWALIGVIFTAYTVITGIISKPESTPPAIVITPNNELLIIRYLLVCIALVFSIGWWLVNRGSKYTSEKWSLIIENLNKSEQLLKDLSEIKPDPEKIKFIKLPREYPISSTIKKGYNPSKTHQEDASIATYLLSVTADQCLTSISAAGLFHFSASDNNNLRCATKSIS